MTGPANPRDDGFTLIELLVAIAILGIITVPVANIIVGYLRNSTATVATLAESHDAQITAAYWAQDVSSVGARSSASPYPLNQSVDDGNSAGWPYPCTVSGSTPVVRLVWDDYPSGPGTATQIRVAYVTETVGGQFQLHRLACAGSSTPTTDTVLAHDLSAAAPPTVSCLTGTGSSSCTGSGSAVPTTITLTLTLDDPTDTSTGYVVRFVGTRRQT